MGAVLLALLLAVPAAAQPNGFDGSGPYEAWRERLREAAASNPRLNAFVPRPRDPECPRPLTRPCHVPATPFVQRDIRVLGLRLRYIDEGRGPALLLIPGMTSRVEEYDQVVRRLRGSFRVLVFDYPGTGYSDKPEREYGLVFYEDVSLAFLDALGIERAHVAGCSLGGNLAVRLAARAPRRVDRVVACAPAGSWTARPLAADGMRALPQEALFRTVAAAQSRFWYSEDYPGRERALRQVFDYYDEVMSPGFLRMYWGLAADQVGRSLFPLASVIRRPVLIAWGDQDHGAGMGEGVRELDALLPRSELRVLGGAGHSLSSERPAELARLIEEFLLRPESRLPAAD